jgi:hypothetical protein
MGETLFRGLLTTSLVFAYPNYHTPLLTLYPLQPFLNFTAKMAAHVYTIHCIGYGGFRSEGQAGIQRQLQIFERRT